MTSRKRAIDGVEVKQGYAYAEPKFGTLNRFANTVFGVNAGGSKITFKELSHVKIQRYKNIFRWKRCIYFSNFKS